MSDITPTSPALPSQPISQPTPAEHSIYVGDLPVGITEEELTKVFGQASPVVKISIGLPKKNTDQVQRAYAHVTYSSAEDETQAIREFNQTEFSGKPCRVTKSTKGTSKGLPEANIFVKDLPLKLSALAFHDTFSAFGEILSSKLAVDHENVSKGYGFVQYATAEQAQKAITETNGSTLDVEGADKPINTSLFVKKESRPPAREFTNLFLRTCRPISLKKNSQRPGDGKPTGTGFANFEKASAAAKVVKATKKKAPNGVHAVRALSKAEREHHQSTKAPSAPEVSA
ncbi:hypothetical protein KEM48_013434 [Puccinia striiformis f. sp. tritici PST-130]|nr:hypothetical protein KEM48_013434 [Puccinia striiformis f. sp. tritici PST-130]